MPAALEEVFRLASRAAELDSTDWLSHAMLGISWLWYGQEHEAAVRELERAVSLNPSATLAYHLLACVLEFSARSREAIASLHTIAKLDPHYHYRFESFRFSDLALSHLSLGEYEQGLAFACQSLQVFPGNVRAMQRQAACLGHLGRLDEGRAALSTLRAVFPDYGMTYLRATYPFKSPQQWEQLIGGLQALGDIDLGPVAVS